jgi:hypothetical protein
LGKAENVVNEEKHVLPLGITEMFSHSQTSKTNTSTSTRGLIHLTIDKSTFALGLKMDIMEFKYRMKNKIQRIMFEGQETKLRNM